MSSATKLARLADLFGGNENGPGLPLSNRNYVVDGAFEASLGSPVVHTSVATWGMAPLMGHAAGTSGSVTSSVNGNLSDPVGMTTPATNYLKHNQTVASTGIITSGSATTGPIIFHKIESATTLNNRSSTFSCWLWTDSGTLTIPYVTYLQCFGATGSPSPTVSNFVAVNWTVTTTPKRFSVRLDWPATAGKTFTTGNFIQITLFLPTQLVFGLNTSQWQLEQSSPNGPVTGNPTSYEWRGTNAELLRLYRFWQLLNALACTSVGLSATALLAPMRATPAVSLIGLNAGSGVTYAPLGTTSLWQNTANSTLATATLICDARL